jgi:predicted flap endonuclease-1-like 5' DNA nuclease
MSYNLHRNPSVGDTMYKLTQIEGIGPKFAAMLKQAGIEDQKDLLQACSSRRGRFKVAAQTGISHKLILKWTNQADLARVNGISEEYAELLEKAGVDSIPELAHRNPEHLYSVLKEKNDVSHLVRHIPGLNQVVTWIEEAKKLPRMVYH